MGSPWFSKTGGAGSRGTHEAKNNYIHHNEVFYLGNSGQGGGASDFKRDQFLNNNNLFDHNIYHAPDISQSRWKWNANQNWTTFQAVGQEPNGKADTNLRNMPPDPVWGGFTPPPPSGVLSISSLNSFSFFLDQIENLILLGSNFDLAESFRFRLKEAGIVKLNIEITPVSTITLEIDLSSYDLSTLTPGFYVIELERISDGFVVTHPDRIVITKLGDIWSSGATESLNQKRDGKIDIFDVSRMLSKWNTADPEVDINPGPNNVSVGIVDIFDANKLMANWSF